MRAIGPVGRALLVSCFLLSEASLAAPDRDPGDPGDPQSVATGRAPGLARVIVELAVASRPGGRRDRRLGARPTRSERRRRRAAIAAMQGEIAKNV